MDIDNNEVIQELSKKNNVQVIIIHNKINKRNPKNKKDLIDLIDMEKKRIIIRMFEIEAFTVHGLEHFMDVLRYCFANSIQIVICEVNSEVKESLTHIKQILFISEFEKALEYSYASK